MEDKLERYMDFAGAVPPCVTPARLEQLAARRRQRLQLPLGMAAAVLGVVLNAISVERFKVVSMICYLAMGWVVVLAMGDFYRSASPLSFWCLLAGGILYTVGAALYGVGKKIPYIHPVFHLFVLAGSVLHTVSVWGILR